MNFYVKLFLFSVVGFGLIFVGAWYFLIDTAEIDDAVTVLPESNVGSDDLDFSLPGEGGDEPDKEDVVEPPVVVKSVLKELSETSDRVNFVVFAHDGSRADTIMFVSFDPTNQYVDIINIPRDTYWEVDGFTDRADRKKINAVFGFGDGKGGSKGLKQEVANMFGVPVHYYVKFNYAGAEAVVNTIGGIEVNVPFDMIYDDIYAVPELHIDIKAGQQVLDGANAVDYLRWRKNNDDIRSTGDLPRIQRMQEFSRIALKKSIGLKLPSVVSAGISFIQTDIKSNLAIALADDAIGMTSNDISTTTLPGKPTESGTSYYIGDADELEMLLEDMYRKGQ